MADHSLPCLEAQPTHGDHPDTFSDAPAHIRRANARCGLPGPSDECASMSWRWHGVKYRKWHHVKQHRKWHHVKQMLCPPTDGRCQEGSGHDGEPGCVQWGTESCPNVWIWTVRRLRHHGNHRLITHICTLAVYSTEKVTAVKTFVTNVCLSEIKGAPIRS